jgi:hypothetical protein
LRFFLEADEPADGPAAGVEDEGGSIVMVMMKREGGRVESQNSLREGPQLYDDSFMTRSFGIVICSHVFREHGPVDRTPVLLLSASDGTPRGVDSSEKLLLLSF